MTQRKLTLEVSERIVNSVRNGNFSDTAAAAAGIGRTTFLSWLRRGEDEPESIYGAFREAVLRARAQSEEDLVSEIRHAEALTAKGTAYPDAKARMWVLERTRRDRFGPSLDLTSKAEDAIREAISKLQTKLDPATFERVLAALSADGSETGAEEARVH